MAERTVDGYIEGLSDWRADAVREARAAIRSAAPEATESIKWAQPVYESNGPFAYVKAFPRTVNVGFWRGAELDDPDGMLIGEGERMKHLTVSGRANLTPSGSAPTCVRP